MRLLFVFACIATLTGCGAAYIPSQVTGSDADVNVRVVPITGETVLIANRETHYTPRRLPAAFSQTAGYGSGLRGADVVPATPLGPENPPASLPLRVPPTPNVGPYEIGVGDVLIIATRQGGNTVEELSGLLAAQNRRQGYVVQDDGTITIPDVGRIAVANMSLSDAEAAIFQKLVENQIDPAFSVEIAEFNSQRVAIGGAVNRPMVVPITISPLQLNEAIVSAGGLRVTERDYATIRIYRNGTLYQIPLRDYFSDDRLQQIRLLDGDSIFVDTNYDLDRAEAYFSQQISVAQLRQTSRGQALANLRSEIDIRRAELSEQRSLFEARDNLGATDRDFIYLAGEVGQPQRFPLPYEQTASVADALFESGGVAPSTGNPGQIYVLRRSTNPSEFGAVTAWHLDASNAVNFTLATQMELRPDDVIFVAEQPVTRWNRVVQQMVPSLIISGVGAVTN